MNDIPNSNPRSVNYTQNAQAQAQEARTLLKRLALPDIYKALGFAPRTITPQGDVFTDHQWTDAELAAIVPQLQAINT